MLLLYRSFPVWLAFLPILIGLVCSCLAGRALAGTILFGSLALAVLGSAIFANPTLFRSVLMTDWLFLLYFLAALSFPAEALSRRVTSRHEDLWATRAWESKESTDFQRALSHLSRRAIWLTCILLLGFFGVSSARLIALTIANPAKTQARQLAKAEADAVVNRLRQPPFNLRASDNLQVYDWRSGSSFDVGQYVVLVEKYDYDYYIPPGKAPPRSRPPDQKPYGRTLVILPQFDFTIAGEIPSSFAGQPLIFVGIVAARPGSAEKLERVQVEGLAVIPLENGKRPDFARAVCAPPSVLLDLVRRP